MASDLQQAWRVNCEMNHRLFDAVDGDGLQARYSAKTRTVLAQFAHIHSVRVYHLKGRGQEFLGDLQGFPRGAEPTRTEVKRALRSSDKAIGALLDHCHREGKVRSWGGNPASYLGYFISHESHHRALAIVALRIAGAKAPKEVLDGLWNWRKKR